MNLIRRKLIPLKPQQFIDRRGNDITHRKRQKQNTMSSNNNINH